MNALELKVPPLVVTALFAALMWLATFLFPSMTNAVAGQGAFATFFAVAGAATALAGVAALRRASTTLDPTRPESAGALVTDGIYRATRNPVYLGFLLALIGWGVWLGHPGSLLLVPLFPLYLNRFQIEPEERALGARFDEAFERYARETRRWL